MTSANSVTEGVTLLESSSQAWLRALARIPHDIYHTFPYHECSGLGTEGEPFLFTFTESGRQFLWPYVLRQVSDVPGCASSDRCDVTSVYGYPGPLLVGGEDEPAFLDRAWNALLRTWRSQRVISAFTRFHPVLGAAQKFPATEPSNLYSTGGPSFSDGICEVGATVSLDLTIPAEEQFRRYRKTLRQDIRKVREHGFSTFHDTEWRYSETLITLYNDSMHRLSAPRFYLINAEWLLRFRAALGDHVHLLVTHREGEVAAVLLALQYRHQIYAHLTGINSAFAPMSPLKQLLDDTRLWAFERGNHQFHLGSGVGGRRDSLFNFKAAFSPTSNPFRLGRWVIDTAAYQTATHLRRLYFSTRGEEWQPGSFFPAYRACLTVPDTSVRNNGNASESSTR